MKLHIYLFRHGQTTYNRDHKFTGWQDPPLTRKGVQDAKKIAKNLKGKRIDVAFHSHTQRSKRTLKEVLKYHPECKAVIENDFMIERSYGKWESKSHDRFVHKEGSDDYKLLLHHHLVDHLAGRERAEFIKAVGEAELKIIRRSYSQPPPGGESVKMVEARVKKFIKMLIPFMKKNKVNVAISAHGNSMRPFRRHFEKFSKDEMMKLENPFDKAFEYTIDA
ncbi:2,3-bisphosphoglycerate-dependent phosphoglycerate mutase [Candidatus Woesearchaeota archaeon]|nr:2,3-bisphosphoglycerate-dependent phosphoglycerate mutase [Candidatus Woesearchaeota archaeon]